MRFMCGGCKTHAEQTTRGVNFTYSGKVCNLPKRAFFDCRRCLRFECNLFAIARLIGSSSKIKLVYDDYEDSVNRKEQRASCFKFKWK